MDQNQFLGELEAVKTQLKNLAKTVRKKFKRQTQVCSIVTGVSGIQSFNITSDNNYPHIVGVNVQNITLDALCLIAIKDASGYIINPAPAEQYQCSQAVDADKRFVPIMANANGNLITVEISKTDGTAFGTAASPIVTLLLEKDLDH